MFKSRLLNHLKLWVCVSSFIVGFCILDSYMLVCHIMQSKSSIFWLLFSGKTLLTWVQARAALCFIIEVCWLLQRMIAYINMIIIVMLFETCADLLVHTWLEPVWYYVKPKSKAIIDRLIDYNKLILAVKRHQDVKFTLFTSLLNLMLG